MDDASKPIEPLVVTITIEGRAAQQIREWARCERVRVEHVVLDHLVCDCGALVGTCHCENDE
jgi:hypothetical protein